MKVVVKKTIRNRKAYRLTRRLRTVRRRQGATGRRRWSLLDLTYNQAFDRGYDLGYDRGYQAGWADREGDVQAALGKDAYNEGKQQGYLEGFEAGLEQGGDGIIDDLLPEYVILPEVSVREVLAAGINALQHRMMRLLDPDQVAGRIQEALQAGTPLNLVRLGDGELLALAQERVLSIDEVRRAGQFLPYAGLEPGDLEARDRLAAAVRRASIVGIPKLRKKYFQNLAFPVLAAHQIDYRQLTLTDSLMNYYLYHSGHMSRLTEGRSVLTVGNLARELAEVLRQNGVEVAGAVAPVRGVQDVDRVMAECRRFRFDLALVSAGIAAVLITDGIAHQLGKVAIDFGHLADAMVRGEAPWR